MKLSLRRSSKKKNAPTKDAPQRTYAHHWDHPKAYTIGLLVIIGILVVPIYTGFAVKDRKSSQTIFTDSPVQGQPALSDKCTDTDGKNYNRKGTVTAMSNGNSYTFEDSCSGNILKEYFCRGNEMASVLQKCPNGCNDGACR